MGFVNSFGETISFECTELIQDLERDILEFGGDMVVVVWCREYNGVTLYVNYDFQDEEDPITEDELQEGEYFKTMTMTTLLEILKIQNEVF